MFHLHKKGVANMLLVVGFDCYVDIVEAPDFVVLNAKDYREQFLDWLCDKNNNHRYWHYENGKKYGLCYRSCALVEWLNLFPLAENDEKARVIESFVPHYNDYDENLPAIYF
jgi:hypothetical protein